MHAAVEAGNNDETGGFEGLAQVFPRPVPLQVRTSYDIVVAFMRGPAKAKGARWERKKKRMCAARAVRPLVHGMSHRLMSRSMPTLDLFYFSWAVVPSTWVTTSDFLSRTAGTLVSFRSKIIIQVFVLSDGSAESWSVSCGTGSSSVGAPTNQSRC